MTYSTYSPVGARAPDRPPPPQFTPNSLTDPKDPTHANLSRAFQRLGEALVRVVSPHLSANSINEIDALIAFVSRGEIIEKLFAEEAYAPSLLLLRERCEQVADVTFYSY